MVVRFKTIPPVVLIPKETQCYLCTGQEEEEPGEKRWANHRCITDKTGCAFSTHVPCMENFIAARLRADPESKLVCACTRPIVKLDGKYVGPLYGQLKTALSDNNEPAIQAVFSQLALQENSIKLTDIFRNAAETDDQELLKKLLESPLATSQNLSIALRSAAAFGHSDFLRILLTSGLITEEARGRAAQEAAGYGHTDCLQIVLENGPIPEEFRISALFGSIINNHESCLRLLLPGREELGTVDNGIQDYLRVLLQKKQLSPQEQGACLRGAASEGDLASVTELCQQESILQKDFNDALYYSCQDPECLKVLLQSRFITEEGIQLTLNSKYYSTTRFLIPLMGGFSQKQTECFHLLEEHKKSLEKERTARIAKLQGKELLSLWVKTAFVVGAAAILHGLWVNYTNQVEAD